MINALQLTPQSSVNPSSVVVWNLDGAQPDRWSQMLSPKTRENPWICYAQSSVKVGINCPMSRQFWSGKRKRSCCLKGEHKKELRTISQSQTPKIQFQSHQRMSRMRTCLENPPNLFVQSITFFWNMADQQFELWVANS